MELRVNECRWQEDSGGLWVCFKSQSKTAINALCDTFSAGKEYDLTVKEHRNKRSLNANAYAWVMMDKLALKLSLPKVPITADDLYREYCKDVADNYEIVPVKEERIEAWNTVWCAGHVGRSTVDLGECRNVKGYHNIKCYFGSSDYDTKQMSRLIDLIIRDCKDNDIETLTPFELDRLKEDWR